MNKNFSTIFSRKFFINTNILTIIFLSLIIIKEKYPQRLLHKIETHQIKSEPADSNNIQSKLSAMNNLIHHPIYEDFVVGSSLIPFKVLLFGNSLSTHGVVETIGWMHKSGMAATALDKDYVHLLLDQLNTRLPNNKIIFRVSNFAEFERNPTSLQQNTIDSFVQFKPDIVLFQLGENVSEEDLQIFKGKYIELINSFKKENEVATLCTTPFFPSLKKNKILDSVAVITKSFLVDLSHISLLDNTSRAENEVDYKGDKTIWKVNGIGIHPGDKGMKNIADQLFITINAIIGRRSNK